MKPLVAPAKKKQGSEHQWAVRGGIANVNAAFDQLRPSLAMTHPFELDNFQKEAVIHLEQVNGQSSWCLAQLYWKLCAC